ncbi:MAG: hypothetical protein Q7J82_08565 [Coriobacteriia bacterium]|nr:hypothetical protein [Coriobacteriia bacterium]
MTKKMTTSTPLSLLRLARYFTVSTVVSLMFACATGPTIDYLAEARKFIAAQQWGQAYMMLEPALMTKDNNIVAQAIELVVSNPPVMRSADEFFTLPRLKAYLQEKGPQTGRDLANIKLISYRRVATLDSSAQARINIDEAFESFFEDSKAKRAERIARVKAAAAKARLTCDDALQCSKMFALTQIFINQRSTMKVQTANDTIIETYGPTNAFAIGMKAIKYPSRGTSADIVLSVACNTEYGDSETKFEENLGMVFKTPCRPQWREGW